MDDEELSFEHLAGHASASMYSTAFIGSIKRFIGRIKRLSQHFMREPLVKLHSPVGPIELDDCSGHTAVQRETASPRHANQSWRLQCVSADAHRQNPRFEFQ